MLPTASFASSTIGWRIVSSSSIVKPTASWRRRSASPWNSTGSPASWRTISSMRVVRRVHWPNGLRAASRSFSSPSR
jgi:hypothetical protein